MEKKTVLEGLGLRKGWIYEAIVATYSGGKPHAAPMGVCTRDLRTLNVEAYKTAQTCRNISSGGCFTLNYAKDPSLFHASLYDKESLRYERAKKIAAPLLKDADACMEVSVIDAIDLGNRIGFAGEIISYAQKGSAFPLVNRAEALAIECLIAASKVPYTSGREKEFLLEYLTYIRRAVSKVAPGSAAEKLVEKVCSGLE